MTGRRFLVMLGVAAVLLAIAFPLYWALVSSLSPEAQLTQTSSLIPGGVTAAHYRALFAERSFGTPIRNSLIVAGATTFLCVTLGAAAAYALARLRFRGRRLVLGGMLAVSMFPQIAIVPPLYLVLRAVGLVDTFPGLILPYLAFAMPLCVWLLVAYFRQLPPDLEDAAMVDGAGRLRLLWEIVLPLAMPGLATAAVVTFIFCWNEFLFALSFTTGPDRQTVPVAVALFRGQYQVPWGEILAATIVSTLPAVVLVAAFQRRIVSGLTAGSIK